MILQNFIRNWLESHDLIPFSVYIVMLPTCSCSIGFFSKEDLTAFLDLLDYSVQCNKSDYIIIESTYTLLLTNIAFDNFLKIIIAEETQ